MDLKYWQEKIRERKMQSSPRDVLKDVASWSMMVFHKVNGMISRYPKSERVTNIIDGKYFDQAMETGTKYGLEYNDEI